jgi:hypothetical protein
MSFPAPICLVEGVGAGQKERDGFVPVQTDRDIIATAGAGSGAWAGLEALPPLGPPVTSAAGGLE